MGVRITGLLRLLWNREDEFKQDRGNTWHRPDSKLQGKGVVYLAVGERDHIPLVYRSNLSVKDVLIEAAKEAQISPIALDFFTLVTCDGKYLLNPQHLISEPECKEKYYFKLCFKACCASELKDIDPKAFNYYFHQCRKDFLDGEIGEFNQTEESFKKYFTLVILEVIWRARQNKVDPVKVIQNPKEYGILKLYQGSFLSVYRQREVKGALKQKLNLFQELKDDKFKFEYLHALESSPDFFVHRITVQKHYHWERSGPSSNVIEWEILISKEFGVKKRRIDKDSDCPEDVLKEFKDVKSIEVDPNNRHIIIIHRVDARPEVLVAKSPLDADRLITLIEGYYRLMVNQYVMLTRAPATNNPNPKYHGPIERKRAEALLDAEGKEDGLYLIRKKRNNHNVLVLSLCFEKKVKHYNIQRNKDGNFVIGSGKPFRDLQSLIEYYTQKQDEKLPISLKRLLPPPVEGLNALLDHQPITPTTERPVKLIEFPDIQKIPENQIERQATLGKGEFGSVRKAISTDPESHEGFEVVLRAVDKGPKAFQEKFYRFAESLMLLKHPNLAQLVGTCVTRRAFILVSEYVSDGPLDLYIKKMSQENKGITRASVVLFGAQIAEGMMFLHSKNCVHGRLCAHNVLVAQYAETVKLTDMGLWRLRLEGAQFFNEDSDSQKFNWCSPESLQSGVYTKESDVWSFGLTLYEMFAMKKPFESLGKSEIMSKYLRGQYLHPGSPNCPKQVEEVIKKCCNPLQEERIKFREILRELRPPRLKMGEDLEKLMICFGGDTDEPKSVNGLADIALEPVSGADDYSCMAGREASSTYVQEQPLLTLANGTDPEADKGGEIHASAVTEMAKKRDKKCLPRANSFPGTSNRRVSTVVGAGGNSRCQTLRQPSVCRVPSCPLKLPCEHEWELNDSIAMQEFEKVDSSASSSPGSNGYVALATTGHSALPDIVFQSSAKPLDGGERYVDVNTVWKKHIQNPEGVSCHNDSTSSAGFAEVNPAHRREQRILQDSCLPGNPREFVQQLQSDNKEYKTFPFNSNEDPHFDIIADVDDDGEDPLSSTPSEANSSLSGEDESYQNVDVTTDTVTQFGDGIIPGFDVRQFIISHTDNPHPKLSVTESQNSHTNSSSEEAHSSDALASLARLSSHLSISVDVEQFLTETKKKESTSDGFQVCKTPSDLGSQQSIARSSSVKPVSSFFGSMTAEEHLSVLWRDHVQKPAARVTSATEPDRYGATTAAYVAGQKSDPVPDYFQGPFIQRLSTSSEHQVSNNSNQSRCAASFPSLPQQFGHIKEPPSNQKNDEVDVLINRFQQFSASSPASSFAEKDSNQLEHKTEGQTQIARSPSFSLEGWGIKDKFTGMQPQKSPERKTEQLSILNDPFSKFKHEHSRGNVAFSSQSDSKESTGNPGKASLIFSGMDLSAWGLPKSGSELSQSSTFRSDGASVNMYQSFIDVSVENFSIADPAVNSQMVQSERDDSSHNNMADSRSDDHLRSCYVEEMMKVAGTQARHQEKHLQQEKFELSKTNQRDSCIGNQGSPMSPGVFPSVLPESRDELRFSVPETCVDSNMPNNETQYVSSPQERSIAQSSSAFQCSSRLKSFDSTTFGQKQMEALPNVVDNVDGKRQQRSIAQIPGFVSYHDKLMTDRASNEAAGTHATASSVAWSNFPVAPTQFQSLLRSNDDKKEARPSDTIEMKQLPKRLADDCLENIQQTLSFKEEHFSTVSSGDIKSMLSPSLKVSFADTQQWLTPDMNETEEVCPKDPVDEQPFNWAQFCSIPFSSTAEPLASDEGVWPQTGYEASAFSTSSHRPLPVLPQPPSDAGFKCETIEEDQPLKIEPTIPNEPDVADKVNGSSLEDSNFTGGYKPVVTRSMSQPTISTIVGNVEPQRRKTVSEMSLDKDKIPDHLNVSYEDIVFSKKIGEGNFGEVLQATINKRVGQVSLWKEDVAVKLLKHTAKQRDKADFVKEAENMLHLSRVKNQYIITLKGVCFAPDTRMLLITELAPRGSLLQYIKNKDNEKLLGVPRLLDFALQIAKGMAYLEEQPLVHRDLAARNILVVREDMVKISDFGLSRMMDYYKVNEGKWPRKWYAPESLEYGRFKPKSDVWSYGVTLWEIFTLGLPPYPGISAGEILDYIKRGGRLPPPEVCPQSIYNVMKDCWRYEPIERPTFFLLSDEILPELQDNEYPVGS